MVCVLQLIPKSESDETVDKRDDQSGKRLEHKQETGVMFRALQTELIMPLD